MEIYINGTGNISPQKTWDNREFLDHISSYRSGMLQCLEPDSVENLDEKYLRRMSRFIRLGWIAARICLEDAGIQKPDAIITGSGWGSIQDSEKFLLSIYNQHENLLPPTPFIQSTHNTVGAQIALLLKCFDYNMAYAHRSFSFEHALLDSMLRLREGDAKYVLTGGIDEITPNQFILFNRLNHWRKDVVDNLLLFDEIDKGTIAGEGNTFFLLQGNPGPNCYAKLRDVKTVFTPDQHDKIADELKDFIHRNGMKEDDIDWTILGVNGDADSDAVYEKVVGRLYSSDKNLAYYKHLCGEYYTSTAFATWLAIKVLKHQRVPEVIRKKTTEERREIKNILIYNHYENINHSFILLSKPC